MNYFSAERESWVCKLLFSMERIFRVGGVPAPRGCGEKPGERFFFFFWGNIIGFRIKVGYFGNYLYSYGFFLWAYDRWLTFLLLLLLFV